MVPSVSHANEALAVSKWCELRLAVASFSGRCYSGVDKDLVVFFALQELH